MNRQEYLLEDAKSLGRRYQRDILRLLNDRAVPIFVVDSTADVRLTAARGKSVIGVDSKSADFSWNAADMHLIPNNLGFSKIIIRNTIATLFDWGFYRFVAYLQHKLTLQRLTIVGGDWAFPVQVYCDEYRDSTLTRRVRRLVVQPAFCASFKARRELSKASPRIIIPPRPDPQKIAVTNVSGVASDPSSSDELYIALARLTLSAGAPDAYRMLCDGVLTGTPALVDRLNRCRDDELRRRDAIMAKRALCC